MNIAELQREIKLASTGSSADRRRVMREARSMGRYDLVPDSWKVRPSVAAVAASAPPRPPKPKTEDQLQAKLDQHNARVPDEQQTSLAKVKTVYRRGAAEYSATPKSGVTADQWAHARVNAFLAMIRTGSGRTELAADTDLLPRSHPKASA